MDLILKFSKKGKKTMVLDGETGASSSANTRQNTPRKDIDEVSDGGSHYSMDDHDVEDVIDCHGSNVANPAKDDKSGDVLNSIISEEYCEDKVSFEIPPIDTKLAEVLNKWLRNLPSRDKIKELFKQCMLPNNVEGLHPVKINALVYNKLSPNYKINDQHLRGINTFFAHGLGPIVSMWDKILKWETWFYGQRPNFRDIGLPFNGRFDFRSH